jgi:hypothetical protein
VTGVAEGNVGEGWYALVNDLDEAVLALVPGRRILQIKEKFGGLRYYVELPDTDPAARERARALIGIAEDRSYKVCEDCSTTDGVTTEAIGETYGWVRSLCPSCREAAEARRKR